MNEIFPFASIVKNSASAPPRVKVTDSPSGSETLAMASPSPANTFSLMLTRLSKVMKGETFTPRVKAASLLQLQIHLSF